MNDHDLSLDKRPLRLVLTLLRLHVTLGDNKMTKSGAGSWHRRREPRNYVGGGGCNVRKYDARGRLHACSPLLLLRWRGGESLPAAGRGGSATRCRFITRCTIPKMRSQKPHATRSSGHLHTQNFQFIGSLIFLCSSTKGSLYRNRA